MEKRFYIALGQNVLGPYTVEQLAHNGQFSPSVLVHEEGGSQWVPANQVPEINVLFAPVAPPQPVVQPQPVPVQPVQPVAQPQPAPVQPVQPVAQPQPAPVQPVQPVAQPQPAPVQPVQPVAQPAPVQSVQPVAQPQPAPVQPVQPVAQPQPAPVQAPVQPEPAPVVPAQPVQPQPAPAQPVQPQPAPAQPEPAPVVPAQPVQPQPAPTQPEPAPVVPAQPVQPQPAPAQPEPAPVVPAQPVQPQPAPAQPEPAPVVPAQPIQPQPAPAQPEPAPVVPAQPVQPQPAPAQPEPAPVVPAQPQPVQQTPAQASEKKPKSKRNLIIIIAIVALLLIGGGIAAFFLLKGDNKSEQITIKAQNQTEETATETVEVSEFSTPDLKMFDLCGHVRSAEIVATSPSSGAYLDPDYVSFTEDGTLETLKLEFETFNFDADNEHMTKDSFKYNILRDSDNRMSSWEITTTPRGYPKGYMNYTFTWNSIGKVSEIGFFYDEGNPNMQATYNEKGLLEKQVMSGMDQLIYKYTYTDFDSHGNWTKRKVECYIDDGEDGELEDTYDETRHITYYDE